MTEREQSEIERKYAVDETAVLPLSPDGKDPRVGDVAELQLEAVYFDTPGLDLLTRGITLRRRTGGTDAGWHLKVPQGRDRKTENHHPLGRAVRAVPRKVSEPVRAIARDQPLAPVATITTSRVAYTLVRGDEPVAILCDDRVSARALLPGQVEQTWREWEVELTDGQPRSVLESIEPLLLDAGAYPSDQASKLGRVLEATVRDRASSAPEPLTKGTAGALLRDHLVKHISALHRQDAAVRAGEPEGVHRMRIAARRLRSALTTTRSLFEESHDGVREELRWLGQMLGPARDAHVIQQRLAEALDAEPPELVLGPVRARLDTELNQDHKRAWADAREALDSSRYYRLLDALDELVAAPLLPTGQARARSVLGGLVRADTKRLHRAVKAIADSDADTHDAALHEARKKAKRLRYAAELATPAGGRGAKRLAKRAKAVQEALGQHQDTVVARERLRQLGAQSFLHGENGFTFGLLHEVERTRSKHAEREFKAAWAGMPGPRAAARWVSKR